MDNIELLRLLENPDALSVKINEQLELLQKSPLLQPTSPSPVRPNQSPQQRPRASSRGGNKQQLPSFRLPLPKARFKFMTHRQIEMVLRTQIHHLETRDPMADDFYAQVMNARRGMSD